MTRGWKESAYLVRRSRWFLQSYRWLRQLPEFFKPQELFSVMKDNQAQEEAEELLQRFEI